MLVAKNLSFERNERIIFDDINFAIEPGTMLQIQGANGAGKTSLLRLLAGLVPATRGNIFWRGSTIAKQMLEYSKQLLYIGHVPAVKANLSVYENLQANIQLARSTNVVDIDQALDQFAILPYKHTLTRYLSAGQQRKVALAKILLLNVSCWILDEP